ncbi:MAG: DUF3108 domain-containing protein [Massilia sp.]
MISAPIRRTVALALLTVGLHVLALLVLAPQLRAAAGSSYQKPPVMEARLIAAPPPPPPPPPPKPPVESAPKPRPKPVKPRSRPVAPPPLPALAENASAPVPASLEPELSAPLVDAGAATKLADVESIQLTAPEPAKAEPAAKPADLVGRAYRTDVPPSARILLDVSRKDADGTLWHGEAAMAWKQDGSSYQMKLEAGIRVLVTRVNLVVLESSGKIDAAGFVPSTMLEKRRGRAQTATHFGAEGDKITFSNSKATYGLAPGTQDKATVPLQLAAIARGDSEQLKGNIDMLVGEDKDASVFRFVLVGQETIDTPIGRLDTWHLSRPPRFNAYNSRLDIWLAPSLGWLPVRIDNTESSGASTTQTVKNIDRQGAG